MSEPFIGEIRLWAGNFAPRGWALCNGQLIGISQNTALFSILGTMYGGNGTTTFGLPNLVGRVPIHAGQGPGTSYYAEGEPGGVETVTLTLNELPSHTHQVNVSAEQAALVAPGPDRLLAQSTDGNAYQSTTGQNLTPLNQQGLPPTGGDLPHDNMQPYLALSFIIALQGIFPPRG